MKRFRTAAILALIVFALGGLATWDEWKTKSDEEAAKNKNRLTTWKVEDVVELDYFSTSSIDDSENPDGSPAPSVTKEAPVAFKLAKKDGVWRVVKPVDALADEQVVQGLIKTLVDYTYGKVVADSQDKWAEYGLQEPQRRIVMKTLAGETSSIFVGNKAPVGYHVYLRTGLDDKTYLGSQYLLTSTSKTLFEVRDKSFVKIDTASVDQLTYEKRGAAPIVVKKQGDASFLITQPQTLAADPAEFRDLLDSLSGARVSGFEDAPPADVAAAFADPSYRISWQTGKDGAASSVLVVEQAGKLLAALDPKKQLVLLPDELKAKLDRDLASFRNRRVLAVDAGELATLAVDGTSYKLVNGDWFTNEDAAKLESLAGKGDAKDLPKEKAHVRALIVDLEFAKTDRFYAASDSAVVAVSGRAPDHRITLGFKDAAKPHVTLELFQASDADDKYVVRRTDVEAYYRIAKSAFASMTPGSSSAPKASDDDEKGPFDGGDVPSAADGLDLPMLDPNEDDAGTG